MKKRRFRGAGGEGERGRLTAVFPAVAGSVTGLYLYFALWRAPGLFRPVLCGGITALCAATAWGAWRADRRRAGSSGAARAAVPYGAFLIPSFFIPDYIIGYGRSAPIALVIVAVSLVCFLALRLLLFSRRADRVMERLSSGSRPLAAMAIGVCITAFIICGAVKYYNFAFPGADLGSFTQSFWSMLHGKLFLNTRDIIPGESHFGRHFSPVMFLILPFFALWPHALTIVALNAVAVGLGAAVVYALAKDALGKYAGLCVALCYLLYPGTVYFTWHMCFMMNYAPLFLLLAYYFYRKKRIGLFCLFLVLSCSVREDIALTTFAFGVYAIVQRRKAVWVIAPAALSAIWFAAAIGIVIPSLGPGSLWDFYGGHGGTIGGITRTLIAQPLSLPRALFAPDCARLVYLILMPLAVVLPLMSPEIIIAFPALLIVALSTREEARYIDGYWYIPLIPFVFAASITSIGKISAGATRIFRDGREKTNIICTFLVFLGVAVFARGFFAESIESGFFRPYNVRTGKPYSETLRKVIALVPPDAGVFAPRYIKPHLALREFVVERVLYEADYLIVDTRTEDPVTVEIQKLDFLTGLDADAGYARLFDERGVRLYRRRGN